MNTIKIKRYITTASLTLSLIAGNAGIVAGQVATPVITDVAAGCQFSLGLQSNGRVWAWGQNASGQLGDGSIIGHTTPAPVPGLSGVVGIGAGCFHAVAVKSDGTVWEWGSTNGAHVPTRVPSITGVVAVAGGGAAGGGYDYSIALKNDGTVWAWGSNAFGKLGNGTTIDSAIPVQVIGLSGITKISAAALAEHSLALKNDGTVWAWGRNNRGEIGNGTGGTGQYQLTPVQVSNITNVVEISAGFAHSTAVTGDGFVWQWGWNRRGEYGNGTNSDVSVPLQTPVGFNGAAKIAGGVAHTMIVKTDGNVWGSGENAHGQLGDGTFTNTLTPVQAVINGVKTISTGGNQLCGATCSWPGHTLAIKTDNTVWAWGYNVNGQVGDGTTSDHNTAVQIFFVAPIDTTAPTAPTNVLAVTQSDTQVNVTWNPSTDNVGVTGYILYRCQGVNCLPVAQIASLSGTSYNDTGLTANTTYGYKLVAVDAAGNHSADSSISYAITFAPPDHIPPTVTVSVNPTSGTTATVFTFTANVTDNVGIQNVVIYVDGVAVQTCVVTGCVYSTTFPVGSHTFSALATDVSGNVGADPSAGSKTVVVTAPTDTMPPIVVSITVTPAPIYAGTSEQITAQITDNVGVSSCNAVIAPGVTIPMVLSPNPLTVGVTATAGTVFGTVGNYTVTVTCADAAGNIGSKTTNVTVVAKSGDGDGDDDHECHKRSTDDRGNHGDKDSDKGCNNGLHNGDNDKDRDHDKKGDDDKDKKDSKNDR